MKKKLGLATVLVASIGTAAVLGMHAFAGGGQVNLRADMLSGYQEATPAGVATDATGTFTASIDDATQTITYELTYTGLSGSALFAHIHFGNRYDSGAVEAFLCGGSTKPACPTGTSGDVTGTITPADVVGQVAVPPSQAVGQGIGPGEWQKLVDAMRAGVTYANVHSSTWPSGEIRGQINDDNQRQP